MERTNIPIRFYFKREIQFLETQIEKKGKHQY